MSPLRATLGAIALLLAPAPAAAGTFAHSKRLWATVNVCDTVGHPDALGIRGSMPSDGSKADTMFMRFQVQFFNPADKHWHNLGPEADSGFVEVGSAARTRQSGITFTITPPRAGSAPYLLRGSVTFEWRDDQGTVVHRERKRTTANHPGTKGSDPVGFSAATCMIS